MLITKFDHYGILRLTKRFDRQLNPHDFSCSFGKNTASRLKFILDS